MMKPSKSILIPALLLIITTQVGALTPALGIKGGFTLAFAWGPQSPVDEGFLPGFSGGLQIPLEFTDIVSLVPEILFSMKGAAWDSTDAANGVWNVARRLNYVEIPISLRLRIPGMHPLNPYFFIGPSVGLLVSAHKTAAMQGVKKEFDHGSITAKVDPSLVAGLGNNFIVAEGKGVVTLEGRFTLGIMSTEKNQTSRNAGGTISLGYAFKATPANPVEEKQKKNKPIPTKRKDGPDESWNN